MIAESYQMLSTALRLKGYDGPELNKVTHANHPCNVWARQRRENFEWLYEHMLALDKERMARWGKPERHLSVRKAKAYGVLKLRHEFKPGWTDWSNSARHKELGLDFTHLPVHQAYRQYLLARWRLQQDAVFKGIGKAKLPLCTVVGKLEN